MNKLSDYTFYNSWQPRELNMTPGDDYVVQTNVSDLKKGERVRFVGFDDRDNHHGIFVFTDSNSEVLAVHGDFSGPDIHFFSELKAALSIKCKKHQCR